MTIPFLPSFRVAAVVVLVCVSASACTASNTKTPTASPATEASELAFGGAVLNASFDGSVDGWEHWWNPAELVVSSNARTGAGALSISATSGQATAFVKSDALIPNHRHRVSLWARGTGGIAGQILQFDDTWTATNTIQLASSTLPSELPADWHRYEATFGVAPSTAHANIAVAADGSTLFLDDVVIEDLGPLQPKLPANPATTAAGPWKLAWADEFDGASLDTTQWTPDDAPTDFNGELHCYTPRPENIAVFEGKLHLTARREENLRCPGDTRFPDGRSYSSALIRSTSTLREGRVEIRASLPAGKGIWPALWLLPKDPTTYTNGRNGEIDIVEVIGSEPSVAHFSIHYDYTKAVDGEGKKTRSVERGAPLNDDFHIYAIEWDTDEIRWYLDGEQLFRSGASENAWFGPDGAPWPAPFDQEFYVIMNLAVGGSWPGEPTVDTQFPATMAVDYVRVLKRSAS